MADKSCLLSIRIWLRNWKSLVSHENFFCVFFCRDIGYCDWRRHGFTQDVAGALGWESAGNGRSRARRFRTSEMTRLYADVPCRRNRIYHLALSEFRRKTTLTGGLAGFVLESASGNKRGGRQPKKSGLLYQAFKPRIPRRSFCSQFESYILNKAPRGQ